MARNISDLNSVLALCASDWDIVIYHMLPSYQFPTSYYYTL